MKKKILMGVGIIIAAATVLIEEVTRNGSPARVFLIWLDPTMPCVTHARMLDHDLSAWDVEKRCHNHEPHKLTDEEDRELTRRQKQLENESNKVRR